MNNMNNRLIPVVVDQTTKKSVAIRKHSFCFLTIILQNWPNNLLEKHLQLLKDGIYKDTFDTDAESREKSRNAWHGLAQHFPNEADEIFVKLSANQQKLIKGFIPSSSSTDSLHQSEGGSSRRSLIPPKSAARLGPRRGPPARKLHTSSAYAGFS